MSPKGPQTAMKRGIVKMKPTFALVVFALWNGFFWGAVAVEVGAWPWRIGMVALTVATILSAILPLLKLLNYEVE